MYRKSKTQMESEAALEVYYFPCTLGRSTAQLYRCGSLSFLGDLHTCRNEASCQQHVCKPFHVFFKKILSDKAHTQNVSLDISKT